MLYEKYLQMISRYPFQKFMLDCFFAGYVITGLSLIAYNKIKNK